MAMKRTRENNKNKVETVMYYVCVCVCYVYIFRIIYLFCFLFKYILCLIHPLLSTKSTIFNATLSTHVEKGLSPSYELIGGVSRVWVAVTNVVM